MRKFLFILSSLCVFGLSAQEHAWVYFKDKPNANTFINNPLTMLSQRALDRRTKQGIALDNEDVPLDENYITTVVNSTGISVKAKSKWLNALHVTGSQADIEALKNLASVDSIQFANKNIGVVKASKARLPNIKQATITQSLNYGSANNQIQMIGINAIHDLDYLGEGMQIAVLDAGFEGVNTANAFSLLQDANVSNGEVLGGYDFVGQSTNFYSNTGSDHGTQVLSTMGARIDNSFIGSAPNAGYYLFVTEDVFNETPLEESLWVQAAERADSLGVDIINSSLGYSEFDNSNFNYTYNDMDGETTFITRGANKAVEKGILVVNSVGNSGSSTFKFLSAPADANNIIAVGAVDASENIAAFSSFGPSADNRVKPEVVAQGQNVLIVDKNNTVKVSNGTSFSGPTIAGATACLWQAFPNKTNIEIRQMLIESADDFLSPTAQRGYGVPDYASFTSLLDTISFTKDTKGFSIQNGGLVVDFPEGDIVLKVQVFSTQGEQVLKRNLIKTNNYISLSTLNNGLYIISITGKERVKTAKLIVNNGE